MSNRINSSPGGSSSGKPDGSEKPAARASDADAMQKRTSDVDAPAASNPGGVPPITVRPGRRSDAATIAVFNIRMARETEDVRLDPSLIERGVIAIFEEPSRGTYFIAEIDGAAAGCLMVTHEWSDWRNGDMWWIQSVYVHPDYRRRGVFRTLYAHVRDAAVESGAVVLRLYVEKHNEAAKKVYASLGMKLTDYDVMQQTL